MNLHETNKELEMQHPSSTSALKKKMIDFINHKPHKQPAKMYLKRSSNKCVGYLPDVNIHHEKQQVKKQIVKPGTNILDSIYFSRPDTQQSGLVKNTHKHVPSHVPSHVYHPNLSSCFRPKGTYENHPLKHKKVVSFYEYVEVRMIYDILHVHFDDRVSVRIIPST